MPLSLISIPTDTHALDGLWYEPDTPARGAAMLLHGNCMNFYTGAPRFLPPHLTRLGLAALAFNRRGHDMVATTEQPRRVGRRLSDDERGNRGQSLRGRLAEGARLCGADRDRPLQWRHAGGAARGGSSRRRPRWCCSRPISAANPSCRSPARSACSAATASTRSRRQARRMVAQGRGGELMVLPGWWHVITAQSYLDYCLGASRRAGAGAAHHLPGALHPRRQGAGPHLSGGGIRRARGWAVRCAHRERLRSFLRRARGHDCRTSSPTGSSDVLAKT